MSSPTRVPRSPARVLHLPFPPVRPRAPGSGPTSPTKDPRNHPATLTTRGTRENVQLPSLIPIVKPSPLTLSRMRPLSALARLGEDDADNGVPRASPRRIAGAATDIRSKIPRFTRRNPTSSIAPASPPFDAIAPSSADAPRRPLPHCMSSPAPATHSIPEEETSHNGTIRPAAARPATETTRAARPKSGSPGHPSSPVRPPSPVRPSSPARPTSRPSSSRPVSARPRLPPHTPPSDLGIDGSGSLLLSRVASAAKARAQSGSAGSHRKRVLHVYDVLTDHGWQKQATSARVLLEMTQPGPPGPVLPSMYPLPLSSAMRSRYTHFTAECAMVSAPRAAVEGKRLKSPRMYVRRHRLQSAKHRTRSAGSARWCRSRSRIKSRAGSAQMSRGIGTVEEFGEDDWMKLGRAQSKPAVVPVCAPEPPSNPTCTSSMTVPYQSSNTLPSARMPTYSWRAVWSGTDRTDPNLAIDHVPGAAEEAPRGAVLPAPKPLLLFHGRRKPRAHLIQALRRQQHRAILAATTTCVLVRSSMSPSPTPLTITTTTTTKVRVREFHGVPLLVHSSSGAGGDSVGPTVAAAILPDPAPRGPPADAVEVEPLALPAQARRPSGKRPTLLQRKYVADVYQAGLQTPRHHHAVEVTRPKPAATDDRAGTPSTDASATAPTTESKYRDRAAERRDGVNRDYEASDAIVAALHGQPMTSETSQFLGGDAAHTHLVKGLDVSLLRQERERIRAQRAETAGPAAAAAANVPDAEHGEEEEKRTGASDLAKSILEAVFKKPPPPPATNPHFYPGRMTFVYDLTAADPFAPPAVLLRSVAPGNTEPGVDVRQNAVLENVLELLDKAKKVARERDAAKAGLAALQGQQCAVVAVPLVPAKVEMVAAMDVDEDDDDIFGDVNEDIGIDIRPEALALQPIESAMPEPTHPTPPPTSVTDLLATASLTPAPAAKPAKRKLPQFDDSDMQDLDMFEAGGGGPTEYVDHIMDEREAAIAEQEMLQNLRGQVRHELATKGVFKYVFDMLIWQRVMNLPGGCREPSGRPSKHRRVAGHDVNQVTAAMEAKYGATPKPK
ncbi:hypothetical protein GGF32_001839 [Allomyces javanicus]|nr:hypothetical protein GGF32_001839 [Allomyces javanicus]